MQSGHCYFQHGQTVAIINIIGVYVHCMFIIISSIVYLYRIDSVLSLMPSIGIQIESHILIMAACVSIKHGHCAICYIDAWKVKLVIELENQR